MKIRTLALVGLLGLGIQACNIAQAQHTLTREDLKNLRGINGDLSPSSTQGALQAPQGSSAHDSDFGAKFNRALSDLERKEQASRAQSARDQMQHREMINGNTRLDGNIRSPHRSTNASQDRTEIQSGKRGTTVCRKTGSGQTQCETQSRW